MTRQLLFILFALSLFPSVAMAACATAPVPCIQDAYLIVPAPYTATSVSQGFTSAAGHTHVLGILVCGDPGCGSGSVSGATVTVSDTVNTYTVIEHVDSITGFGGWLAYAPNVAGGTVTVTLSISGVATPYYLQAELSEWDFPSSPLDSHANNSLVLTPGNIASVSITTANANETILALGFAAAGGARTAGLGFTYVNNANTVVEESFKASPGTYSAQVTFFNSNPWFILAASFNPVIGPASTNKHFFLVPER